MVCLPLGFTLSTATRANEVRISAQGEIDLVTSLPLAEAIQAAETSRPPALTVDMADVTFTDASALRVLLDAARRARLQQRSFVVANPSDGVRRLLRITAIDQTVEVLGEADGHAVVPEG